MMKLIICTFFGLMCSSLSASADAVRWHQEVKGAGPSTEVAKQFFSEFSKREEISGYTFTVEDRSTKHAGGIRASSVFLFGRTGRPLSPEEKKGGKEDLFLASTPLGFIIGPGVGLTRLDVEQVRAIFCRKVTSWAELGGPDKPIYLVGRESTEAALSVLRISYPFLDDAVYDAILKRDHAVINLMNSPVGEYAIAYGPLLHFNQSSRVSVDGERPLLSMGLVYDVANRDLPVVRAARNFALTEAWQAQVRKLGFELPVSGEGAGNKRVAGSGCS